MGMRAKGAHAQVFPGEVLGTSPGYG